jgi:hypothetical protein
MPLFATLVSAAINGLITFFSLAMSYQAAIAWARRTFIIGLGIAFITAVATSVTLLLGMVPSALSGLPSKFLMGLGIFIPSNAAIVLSSIGTVWLACVVYRLKLEGLRW